MSIRIGLFPSLVMSMGLAAQPQWTRPPLHENRFGHVSAFDTSRGRLVVFGGSTWVGAIAETWEWDGSTWTQPRTAQSPPGGEGHAMTYDPVRRRALLFANGETWEWDGNAWAQRAPTRTPSTRSGHCMTWDATRQRALLFGGSDTTGLRDDTWEWDGSDWTQRQSANRPPRRTRAAMTFVTHLGRILLTGGICPSFGPCAYNDAWTWDGTDWAPAGTTGGFGRWDHRLAYDPVRQRVVMFGGSDEPAHYFGDTWEWDGMTWLQRTPTVNPRARAAHVLEYDPRAQSVILADGAGWLNDVYGDVWRWAPTANVWQLVSVGQPTWREMPAMAHVASRGRAVMFGGLSNGVETWEWDGSGWIYHDLSGPPPRTPPANLGDCLASDGARAWLVTGSAATELWAWDGATWTRTPTTVVPPGGEAHALTFDAARAELVLFTAATTIRPSETYTSNRVDWRRRQAAVEPPPRRWHAMAYDAGRERVVLFGGASIGTSLPLSDTWEWDGQAWRQLFPPHVPSARSRHRLIYDEARRRVVMLGWGARPHLEVWEWDGTDWQERVLTGGPPYPALLGAAYDGARSEVLVFAGVPDQTWRLAPTILARYTTIGAGCAGTRGTPTLSARGGQRPWLGDTFTVEIGNLPTSPLVVLLVGASRQQWGAISLPASLAAVGMPGCTLHVSGEVAIPFANVNGQVPWSVAIPADPVLAGAQFYNQAWVADPLANPANAIVSSAAEAVMALR